MILAEDQIENQSRMIVTPVNSPKNDVEASAREQIALANISKLDSARFTRTARGHARRVAAVADRGLMSDWRSVGRRPTAPISVSDDYESARRRTSRPGGSYM